MVAASFGLSLVIWSQFISPFHFGKVVMFRWLVEVMAVLWAVVLLKYPSYRPRRTLLINIVVAFTAVFVVTTLTAEDLLRAWWGSLERMGGLFTFLHYVVWMGIVLTVVRSGRQWENLMKLSIVISGVSAFYGFAQEFEIWRGFIQGEELGNPVGTIGNAALFAGFLLINFFFAAYFFLRERTGWRWRLAYGGALAVMGLNILMSNTRGSVAGVAVGLIVMTFLLPRRSLYERRLKMALVVMVLVLVGSGLFLVLVPNSLSTIVLPDGLQSFRLNERTMQTRLWAWGASWQGFLDKPVLGWGSDNYTFAFNAHFNPLHYNAPGSETWFDRAHNVFLDIMVAHGTVGFVVFIALLFVLFQRIWRMRPFAPVLSAALFGGMLAYLVHDSWILDTFVNYLLLFFIIALVDWFDRLARAQDGSTKTQDARRKNNGKAAPAARRFGVWERAMIGALALAMPFLGYWGGWRPIQVNWNTTRAMIAGTRDLRQAMDRWEVALGGSYSGKPESIFQLLLYAIRLEENDRLPIGQLDSTSLRLGLPVPTSERQATLKFAEHQAAEFLKQHSYEAQLHIILGRAQNMIGSQYDKAYIKKAEITMRHGLTLSGTRPRFYYELGQSLLNQGRTLEALETYEKARAINPDVGISWWYAAVIKNQLGRSLEALQDIEEAKKRGFDPELNSFQLRQFVDVHLALGNYPEAVRLLEKAVDAAPTNASLWAALAETYRRTGRFDDARAAADRLRALDPSRSETVDAFLNDLASQSAQ